MRSVAPVANVAASTKVAVLVSWDGRLPAHVRVEPSLQNELRRRGVDALFAFRAGEIRLEQGSLGARRGETLVPQLDADAIRQVGAQHLDEPQHRTRATT